MGPHTVALSVRQRGRPSTCSDAWEQNEGTASHTRPDQRRIVGLEDITKKAQEFLGDNKVQEALKSEKAEDLSDKLLDGVAGAVNKVTGEKFDEQVEGARAAADKAIGTE